MLCFMLKRDGSFSVLSPPFVHDAFVVGLMYSKLRYTVCFWKVAISVCYYKSSTRIR